MLCRLRILVVAALAAVMLVAGAASIQAQTVTPCMGGCDTSAMPTAYDPAAMWATYGYPQFSGGVWWYNVDGQWWYTCDYDGLRHLCPSDY
jgi:hypothetical protein